MMSWRTPFARTWTLEKEMPSTLGRPVRWVKWNYCCRAGGTFELSCIVFWNILRSKMCSIFKLFQFYCVVQLGNLQSHSQLWTLSYFCGRSIWIWIFPIILHVHCLYVRTSYQWIYTTMPLNPIFLFLHTIHLCIHVNVYMSVIQVKDSQKKTKIPRFIDEGWNSWKQLSDPMEQKSGRRKLLYPHPKL